MTDIEEIVERVLNKVRPAKYLTVSEISRDAQLNPETVKKFCYSGKLQFTVFGPKSLRIKTRDWIKFCEKLEKGR